MCSTYVWYAWYVCFTQSPLGAVVEGKCTELPLM